MRKTDQKRQHILDTAYRLFRSNGFEKTTMSEITAAAGGSKATVYNYFPSKEELFLECMVNITDHLLEGLFAGLQDPKADVSAALLNLGKDILRLTCTPEMLASRRLVIAEAARSGIGKLFHEKTLHYMQELAAFLRGAMQDGYLREADPLQAAYDFRALLEADILERCLLGATKAPPSAAAVSRAARNAVAAFLRAYAMDRTTSGR
ncbi:MAG TPA: TetR/AcrR family transcriptional regulator [Rhodocyclaceae bacterium]